jgi:hypothetical protein
MCASAFRFNNALFDRSAYGLFKRPLQFSYSLANRAFWHSIYSALICKAGSHAIIGKHSGSSGIPALFKSCCPNTIFRGIPLVVINPLNAMFKGWATPHVCQKSQKTSTTIFNFLPSFANCYTPGSIIFMRSAPAPHIKPNSIFWKRMSGHLFTVAGLLKFASATTFFAKVVKFAGDNRPANAPKVYFARIFDRKDNREKPIGLFDFSSDHKVPYASHCARKQVC